MTTLFDLMKSYESIMIINNTVIVVTEDYQCSLNRYSNSVVNVGNCIYKLNNIPKVNICDLDLYIDKYSSVIYFSLELYENEI